MESEERLIVKSLIVTMITFALTVGVLIVSSQTINVMVQPDIIVMVNGEEVFVGTAAAVNVTSAGSMTNVSIGRGFLYLLPGKKYVSNRVHVENLEDWKAGH